MGLLDSVLGGGQRSGGGMSPITMALLGLLAYRTIRGKGKLGEMHGKGDFSDPDRDGVVTCAPTRRLLSTASHESGVGP